MESRTTRPLRRERDRPRRRIPPPCADWPARPDRCKRRRRTGRRDSARFGTTGAKRVQLPPIAADTGIARFSTDHATSTRSRDMLDALKSLTGGNKLVQQQTAELETLIATAREERSAISAMLTALTTRSQKLTPLNKSLEQVTEKAATVDAQLAELARRLTAIDERTREVDAIDKRVEALKDAAK